MRRKMQRDEERRQRRYVDSKRHRIEVDYYPYVWDIQRERRMGRARVRQLASTEAATEPA